MKSKTIIFSAVAIGLMIGVIVGLRAPEKPKPMTVEQSLDHQALDGGLYRPDNLASWRNALIRRLKPEIAIIGSGEALAFGADSFNIPFINLGGMPRLEDAISSTQTLFASHPPKVLLIAVDERWLETTPKQHVCSGMLCAAHATDGYAADGSYHPLSLWTGKNAGTADSGFAKSIQTSNTSSTADTGQVQKFSSWLAALKGQHVSVIVFVPPAASKLKSGLNLDGIDAAAKANGAAYFDERLNPFHLDDCEFSSGYEPGEILAKRILLDMATRSADLQSVVKLAEIGWDIDHYGGRVSKLVDETDFLNLGCSKISKPRN